MKQAFQFQFFLECTDKKAFIRKNTCEYLLKFGMKTSNTREFAKARFIIKQVHRDKEKYMRDWRV